MQPSHKTTRRIFLFLFPFTLFLASGCQKNTTPMELTRPQVTLSAEAGVIEAWLTVTTEETQGGEVVLTRDGAERLRFALPPVTNGTVAETTVVDTGLLPAHSYIYAARLVKNGETAARSNSMQLTTMGTTSHNFNWEIHRFGGVHGSSQLVDAAVINENDIWAVGVIHTAETDTFDSTGNWVSPYNAVHWDGSEWELKHIRTNACGGVDYPPIKTIFAFSSNDVLFAHIDGSITHFNGTSFVNDCSLITELNGSAEKMWGLSRNDLYVVSGNGFIAHYDGSGWQRILINTDLDFQDIWGAKNNNTGEWQILAVASKPFVSNEHLILQLKPQPAILSDEGINGSLETVWFSTDRKYYIAGNGIYKKYRLSQTHWQDISRFFPNVYRERIRGNGLNDIFLVGHFGLVSHWNGAAWHTFPATDDIYYGLAVKGDIVVAVGQYSAGFVGGAATVLVGRRN